MSRELYASVQDLVEIPMDEQEPYKTSFFVS